jgi:hypothetical protein
MGHHPTETDPIKVASSLNSALFVPATRTGQFVYHTLSRGRGANLVLQIYGITSPTRSSELSRHFFWHRITGPSAWTVNLPTQRLPIQ